MLLLLLTCIVTLICLYLFFSCCMLTIIAEALDCLDMSDLLQGFKTDTSEALVGLQNRFELLKHLARVLQRRPDYFSGEEGHVPRPGNMMGT